MKRVTFYICLFLGLVTLSVLIRLVLYSYLIDELKLPAEACYNISLICYGFTFLGLIFGQILTLLGKKGSNKK